MGGANEARGALVVAESAAGRVATGRFAVAAVPVAVAVAVAVAVDEASDGREAGFAGDERAAVPDATGGRRTAGFFLLSSPEVTDDTSCSISEAVLDDETALRVAEPAAGRVGGLFRLEPTALVREAAVVGALDALVAARGVDSEDVPVVVVVVVNADGAAGRRAAPPTAEALVAGRRRATGPSLEEAGEGALEAILRRTDDVGVEGAGSFFGCGVPAGTSSERALSREEP